ncbi:MAG TPA: hypothetical protein VL171_08880 [Verrucomicrobiae bacterium]|nr:hypothetical protein [Verrucomicrobiae bacterium]
MIAVSLIAGAALCFATSVPPRPLDWLVRSSQHIIIGVATNLDVSTQDGKPVSLPDAQISGTDVCRLSVEVVEVIESDAKPVPKTVTIAYSNKWIRTLDGERKAYLGKRMIYFLRGKDYAPVDVFQFVGSVEQLAEVRDLLRRAEPSGGANSHQPAAGARSSPHL